MVRVVTGITVERRLITIPAGGVLGPPICIDDPADCCAGSGYGYGYGYGSGAGSGGGGGPGPVEVVCCPGILIPGTLYAHFSSSCPCYDGRTIPLVWDGTRWWSGPIDEPCNLSGEQQQYSVSCVAGTTPAWKFSSFTSTFCHLGTLIPADSADCSPFSLVFTLTSQGSGSCPCTPGTEVIVIVDDIP